MNSFERRPNATDTIIMCDKVNSCNFFFIPGAKVQVDMPFLIAFDQNDIICLMSYTKTTQLVTRNSHTQNQILQKTYWKMTPKI